VILIPTTIVAAIVFVIKPQWLTRYGIALALASSSRAARRSES
jgi:hypothetical protein